VLRLINSCSKIRDYTKQVSMVEGNCEGMSEQLCSSWIKVTFVLVGCSYEFITKLFNFGKHKL
jgi:hypothetical protein